MQFARDFKTDLNVLAKAQAGATALTRKLIEADVLSGDIIQHHYQTCSMYNACVLTREQFGALPPTSRPVPAPLAPRNVARCDVDLGQRGVRRAHLAMGGGGLDGVLALTSVRPLGSASVGLQEAHMLGRHIGSRPLTRLALTGRAFRAEDTQRLFSIETELAGDQRSMSGYIWVGQERYHVRLWRR